MNSPEDVAAWVAEHEREHGNGIAGLRTGLTRGIIAGRGALDGAGPAEGAAEALRARSAGSGHAEAWLGALVPVHQD